MIGGRPHNVRLAEVASPAQPSGFDDESMTAVFQIFEPGTVGDLGRGENYYPKSLVNQDSLNVFKGTLGYIDHPEPSKANLERSIRDIGFKVLDAYEENGLPYAKVKFTSRPYFELAKELKDDIGPSVVGNAEAVSARLGKKNLNYVRKFKKGTHMDLVSSPGAGGKIVSFSESATGGEFYMDDVTLEDLESSEKGKELITAIREAATQEIEANTKSTVDAAVSEAVKKIASEKDAEIVALREAASQKGTLEEQVTALTTVVYQQREELQSERKARSIEVKVREAALPTEIAKTVAGTLLKLPEEDWDNLLETYKSIKSAPTTKVEGAGFNVPLREGASAFGGGSDVTKEAIDKAAADLLDISVEDYRNINPRGMTLNFK